VLPGRPEQARRLSGHGITDGVLNPEGTCPPPPQR
jgi:hypothetical protein